MEGDSEGVHKRLTFCFDRGLEDRIEVVCELHTKLESIGHRGNSKYRFDRIYFSQGKAELFGNKVLIAHIGKHL
jgi:hypothetical protein